MSFHPFMTLRIVASGNASISYASRRQNCPEFWSASGFTFSNAAVPVILSSRPLTAVLIVCAFSVQRLRSSYVESRLNDWLLYSNRFRWPGSCCELVKKFDSWSVRYYTLDRVGTEPTNQRFNDLYRFERISGTGFLWIRIEDRDPPQPVRWTWTGNRDTACEKDILLYALQLT